MCKQEQGGGITNTVFSVSKTTSSTVSSSHTSTKMLTKRVQKRSYTIRGLEIMPYSERLKKKKAQSI